MASAWPVSGDHHRLRELEDLESELGAGLEQTRAASSLEVMVARSNPAEKRPGRPASTTAAASSRARPDASWRPAATVWEMALALPSSRVTTATRSWSS